MFDLFRSRQKATRILLTVLLGAVALSMLVYLIPGAGSQFGGSRNDQVVAEIGPEVITVRDMEVQIRNATQGRQIAPEVVSAILPQIVQRAITDRAMAYEAQRLGFKVSDRDLANGIRSLGQVGDMSPQQYQQFIEQQLNQTVSEFENGFRQRFFSEDVANLAREGSYVSPAEVEAEYRRRNEMVKLDYIAFDPARLTAQVKATPQELKDYFDKNKGLFSAPESRNVQLIVADQVKVAESISTSDAQVQSYYNSHRDQYRTAERVKARDILISILNKPPDQVPKLKAKAEDVLKQLKSGADFAKMAEQYSDDKSNSTKGGDLGWVMRGQMVPEVEKATFALKAGQTTGVISTNYGFQIIQVQEKEEGHQRSLDEVRNEIVSILKNQVVSDRMQTSTDQARAELLKAPGNAQQIASKLGLLYASVDNFKPGDTLPELGSDAQISGAISTMQKGSVSEVMQSGEKLAIAVVTKVNPPHPAQFDEVQAQVLDRYEKEKATQLVTEKSNKAAEAVKAGGGDLKAAAKAVGLEVKTTTPFNRNGAAEGIGDARYLGDAFDKPVGTVIGPLNVGTQTVIAKIVDRTSPDMSKLAQQRELIVDQLKSQKSAQNSDLMGDSILNYLVQKGKVKIHQDVLDRLRERYRS